MQYIYIAKIKRQNIYFPRTVGIVVWKKRKSKMLKIRPHKILFMAGLRLIRLRTPFEVFFWKNSLWDFFITIQNPDTFKPFHTCKCQ